MRKTISIFLLFVLYSCHFFAQSTVVFQLNASNIDSSSVIGLRGNTHPLSWDQSIKVDKHNGKYSVQVVFPDEIESIEFKFVRQGMSEVVEWEGIENRKLSLAEDSLIVLDCVWDQENTMDISEFELIPSANLMQDYALIEKMILDIHPGTFRYRSQEEVQAALGNLKSAFSDSLSYGDAYLAISKMTAFLQCDHTKAGFNNQSKRINSIIHAQKDKLPFTFRWVEGEMVVVYNATDNARLSRGTVVKSINGMSSSEILNRLLPYIGADGATDGNRIKKLEITGFDFRYDAFDIFYSLVFKPDSTIQVDIQNFGEKTTELHTLRLVTRNQRAAILANKYPEFPRNKDDLWRFTVLNDSVAILELNSFGLTGWKSLTLDYKSFFDDVFVELDTSDITHLIIDQRQNTGGNDEIAIRLYEYLTKETYAMEREGRTRYVEFPNDLKPFIKTWGDNPWYFGLEPKEEKTIDGYYVFPNNFQSKDLPNLRKTFDGNLYLLTSAANTSLAFYSALQFKNQKLGIVIGQETGGNLNDINGGQILFLRLPNTDIEIDFPVMGGFMIEPQKNTGVVPDIVTEWTLEDIINDRDVEIVRVLELIDKSKQN